MSGNIEVILSSNDAAESKKLHLLVQEHTRVTHELNWPGAVQLGISGIILLLICSLNGIVLYYTLRYRSLRRRVSSLMISLAGSDLLVGLVCIPLFMYDVVLRTWLLGDAACKVLRCVEGYVMTINALTLVSMATIRLRRSLSAANRGELSDKWLLRLVACIWIVSAVLCSPISLVYTVSKVRIVYGTANGSNVTLTQSYCHEKASMTQAQRYAYKLVPPLLHCIAPAVFIVICYCHIGMVISSQTGRREAQQMRMKGIADSSAPGSSKQQDLHTANAECARLQHRQSLMAHPGGTARHIAARVQRRAIRTVVALAASFVVCSLPKHIINLLLDFLPAAQFQPQKVNSRLQIVQSGLLPAAHLFMFLHTVMSPVLYWYYNTTFRSYVRRAVASICE